MSIFTKSKQRFRRHKLKQLGIEPVSCKTSALYGGDHGWVVDESLLINISKRNYQFSFKKESLRINTQILIG